MEELEDLNLQIEGTAMKTMKRRWGHRALPAGFALCQYPKGSSYLMIAAPPGAKLMREQLVLVRGE
jgi:hypothetical protein